MLESLLGPFGTLLGKAIGRLAGQPHFKLYASISTPAYPDRAGGYLALGLKIANVGKETAYFDRVMAIKKDGTRYDLLINELKYETPVPSNRSVLGFIPVKPLLEPDVVDIEVFDAVERSYRLGKSHFRKIKVSLVRERERLVANGYEVDWQP